MWQYDNVASATPRAYVLPLGDGGHDGVDGALIDQLGQRIERLLVAWLTMRRLSGGGRLLGSVAHRHLRRGAGRPEAAERQAQGACNIREMWRILLRRYACSSKVNPLDPYL